MLGEYPIVTTRGVVVFPNNDKTIEVGRPLSVRAISLSKKKFNNQMVVVAQRDFELDKINSQKDIYGVGTLVRVITKDYKKTQSGMHVILKGLARVSVDKLHFHDDYLSAEVTELPEEISKTREIEAHKRNVLEQIEKALVTRFLPKTILHEISSSFSGSQVADSVAHYLPISVANKQSVLSERSIVKRLKLISGYITTENEIVKIERGLHDKMRDNLKKQQREFILREKLRAVKHELGEISSKEKEISAMKKKANSGILPINVQKEILAEIHKYEGMPTMAAESNVSKSYIEWVLKVPWKKQTKDSTSLTKAKKILARDHYGLKKIKERIIEYLAVKSHTQSSTTPIICFVGPPGVGKSSLAKSIASAMNRTFVKISLGGVRDEAEIRGHRRTYIGAMPGKIIKAMVKAQVNNPLILLDEIDKMSHDYRGDPTSAMLEVLDPEQNKWFQDHYLEFEYDLSKVTFVATANYYQNIPRTMLDRMEVIQLHSYTDNEKIQIAKRHLIKKTLSQNGLKSGEFQLSNSLLAFLINRYTLESGVRGLIRVLDKLARKLVVRKLSAKTAPTSVKPINQKEIVSLLGTPVFNPEQKDKRPQIGAVTALAFTQYGGSTMTIESTLTPGRGRLKLTGQLKDVMSESANIALTYVKANAKKYNISTDFSKFDIHIHAPAGAIPKDGPSAGVTFVSAIISMFKNYPVSQNVAMTGEVTLRGHVLPVGGLKEKCLAAVRLGIKTVFIPKQNEKKVKELDKEITSKLNFEFVDNYSEIYKKLFI